MLRPPDVKLAALVGDLSPGAVQRYGEGVLQAAMKWSTLGGTLERPALGRLRLPRIRARHVKGDTPQGNLEPYRNCALRLRTG